ncbi:MAG: 2-dehydro-3-deoxygalactonokinase [Cypionkella sp.]|nr:2-dehydro-3-deoxygalactonokinase [Cypionkella sp.]
MTPTWIAIDWGTTNLRGWAMGPAGVLAEGESPKGMSSLKPAEFEPALLEVIGPWIAGHTGAPIPVYACGMVGAKQGWVEAPYRLVPCAPVHAGELMSVPVQDARISVQITPGLKQEKPADVMRGEETQIGGALALHPNFDGAICLPGTHSKWTQVSAGEVVSFQTFMTGEMFALLSTQSVLRLGMGGDGWDDGAFDTGVAEGMARPERMAASLFRLRAEGLLAGLTPDAARARLSGLLIGAELAAARAYWLGMDVALIGSAKTAPLYARALAAQGVTARAVPAADCTLAGLSRAAGHLAKDKP